MGLGASGVDLGGWFSATDRGSTGGNAPFGRSPFSSMSASFANISFLVASYSFHWAAYLASCWWYSAHEALYVEVLRSSYSCQATFHFSSSRCFCLYSSKVAMGAKGVLWERECDRERGCGDDGIVVPGIVV